MKNNLIKVGLIMILGIFGAQTSKALVAQPVPEIPSGSLCKGSGVICKVSGPWTGGVPSTWDSEKDKDGSGAVIHL